MDQAKGKRRAVVIAPHFEPGYRAGGTLRSLVGIVDTAPLQFEIAVITSDRDLGSKKPYPGLSGQVAPHAKHQVLYVAPRRLLHWVRAWQLIRGTRPQFIYVNSLFNIGFAIAPTMAILCRLVRVDQLVVAPRGQLASGALAAGNPAKKALLRGWKRVARRDGVWFHATDAREREQITAMFPGARIVESMDPVDLPEKAHPTQADLQGRNCLRAVFVGRVSPVKQLDLLLRALASVRCNVHLRIVGPLDEREYVTQIEHLLEDLPEQISAQLVGPLPPHQVATEFASADVFLFPTAGENFGHVLAESLANSCPVVCAAVTPFTEVLRDGGGEVAADFRTATWARLIETLAAEGPARRAARHAAAGHAYETWRASRDASHVFDLIPNSSRG